MCIRDRNRHTGLYRKCHRNRRPVSGQEDFSECGGTVLSLLTTGIDEASAKGALLSGRPCIGVLGTSHERFRSVFREELRKNGALVSEYPPGRETARHFFRERNRIAAGLSVGVVVIEAPEHSGTRLFVQDAVEQGKDIFAVPGNADAENAAGTLSLLKEGAKLVTCGEEVLEEYELRFPILTEHSRLRGSAVQNKETEEAVVAVKTDEEQK